MLSYFKFQKRRIFDIMNSFQKYQIIVLEKLCELQFLFKQFAQSKSNLVLAISESRFHMGLQQSASLFPVS